MDRQEKESPAVPHSSDHPNDQQQRTAHQTGSTVRVDDISLMQSAELASAAAAAIASRRNTNSNLQQQQHMSVGSDITGLGNSLFDSISDRSISGQLQIPDPTAAVPLIGLTASPSSRASTHSSLNASPQPRQQPVSTPLIPGPKIIRSAAILPGETDITGEEEGEQDVTNPPFTRQSKLQDQSVAKSTEISKNSKNIRQSILLEYDHVSQSDRQQRTVKELDKYDEGDDEGDDDGDDDGDDEGESIPESEEFIIDSVAVSRSMMRDSKALAVDKECHKDDYDDDDEEDEDEEQDSDESGDKDSLIHPSKHRSKKLADVATQTKPVELNDLDKPELQLPSFQATPLDFIAAVEDDYEYLLPLQTDDSQDLMRPVQKSSLNEPVPLKTFGPRHAVAGRKQQHIPGQSGPIQMDRPQQQQKQPHQNQMRQRSQQQSQRNQANNLKQSDKHRSQNLLGSMALEKRIRRVEMQNRRAKMSKFTRAIYDFSKWFQLKQNYLSRAIGLWASHLRFIESRFGTGIVSYFSLYRWNFVLNLVLALFWIVFVILFGVLEMFRNNNEGWQKFWNGPYLNETMDAGTFAQQLFSGQGSIERSFFLYGNYKSRYDDYQVDLAYICLIFAFYIVSFVAIIRRMRKLFVSRPELSGNISVDEASPFGTVVFASWDFCISQKDTQTNHCFAVSTTLISRVEISEKQKQISRRQRINNILRRMFGNLVVIILLCSYGFLILISLANQFSKQISWLVPVTQTAAYKWTQTFPNFVSSTALLISFFNAILPMLFWAVTRFERYTDPVNEARIMLARTYLMKMSSIYIVLVGYFYTYSDGRISKNWENEIGKTYYQLIWTNFAFTAVGTILIGFGTRLFLGKKFYDFGISDNILEVIYRQALVWVGTVYSPMAIIVSLVTSYLLFFIKKFVLVHCSLPPKRIYNSYTQNLYFLGFQLITLGLMAFPVFYSVTRMKPTCGPFGPDNFPIGQGKQLEYAYQIVSDRISRITYPFFREALTFLGSIGFILPLILLLSIWIYYLRAVSEKRQKRSKQLHYELNMERADKKFLLRYYKVKL